MAREIWKLIPSQPGYEVSSHGQVRSPRGTILKQTAMVSGHKQLSCGRESKRLVHHLVLEAFVGPRPEGQESRHRDGDSGNNKKWNLCWGTRSENNRDRTTHGQNLLTREQVKSAQERQKSGETGTTLAGEFGVSKSTMYYALSGEYYG